MIPFKVILFLSLLLGAYAFPTRHDSSTDPGDSNQAIKEVASTITTTKWAHCTIPETVSLPLNQTKPSLPGPAHGLTLKHLAIGRGTQNYTCTGSDKTSAPSQLGAVATLFDGSCLAAQQKTDAQRALSSVVGVVKMIPLQPLQFAAWLLNRVFFWGAEEESLVIGRHYFLADGTPLFEFGRGGDGDDWVLAKKDASGTPFVVNANAGDDAPWLKLGRKDGRGVQEIYRVYTAGGNAPSTCEGQEEFFEVEYAAEYWFYG